jgi:hypothetical protein
MRNSGHDFSGDLVRYNQLPYTASVTGGDGFQAADFDVPAAATDLLVTYQFTCDAGQYLITLGPVDPSAQQYGYTAQGMCAPNAGATIVVATNPGGAKWGIVATCACNPPTNEPEVNFWIRQLVTFKAGSPPA